MKATTAFSVLVAAIGFTAAARATPAASSLQNVVVYHEKDRFAGWPANGELWAWGNEIAVLYAQGWFKHDPNEHSRDKDKPAQRVISRSRDGGVTWQLEALKMPGGEPKPAPGGIDFSHPDLALFFDNATFSVSTDRARTWSGPFALPDFKLGDRLTSRTDYIVNGPSDCLVFLSVRDERLKSGIPDRAFAVRTRDGGKNFEFLGWMTGDEPIGARSVMPETVRADDGTLVTTLRRRYDLESSYRNDINWIDAYTSEDDGITWKFGARIAHTDNGDRNGNPPSLVKLPDGRIAAAYGVRYKPYGIRARVSSDNGRTWGPELILRDDARTWDIGYCQSVVRADGKIVTVYYYATKDHFENHIEATIWAP